MGPKKISVGVILSSGMAVVPIPDDIKNGLDGCNGDDKKWSNDDKIKQECIPVGCVPAERWPYSGGEPPPEKLETPRNFGEPPPQDQTPPPWTEWMTEACENITSGGSKGGCQGCAPPWGPKFFHFHAVFDQKNRFAHPLGELASPLGKILDPPLITLAKTSFRLVIKQDCIPVGCVPPTCWLYLAACSALEGGCLLGGGVYGPGGSGPRGVWSPEGVWSSGGCLVLGCLLQGGVWSGGCLVPGGVCSREGVCSGGCVWSEGGLSQCMLGYHTSPAPDTPPLLTEFLIHAYENITLPQTSFAGGNNVIVAQCEWALRCLAQETERSFF